MKDENTFCSPFRNEINPSINHLFQNICSITTTSFQAIQHPHFSSKNAISGIKGRHSRSQDYRPFPAPSKHLSQTKTLPLFFDPKKVLRQIFRPTRRRTIRSGRINRWKITVTVFPRLNEWVIRERSKQEGEAIR